MSRCILESNSYTLNGDKHWLLWQIQSSEWKFEFTGPIKVLLVLGWRTCAHHEDCRHESNYPTIVETAQINYISVTNVLICYSWLPFVLLCMLSICWTAWNLPPVKAQFVSFSTKPYTPVCYLYKGEYKRNMNHNKNVTKNV